VEAVFPPEVRSECAFSWENGKAWAKKDMKASVWMVLATSMMGCASSYASNGDNGGFRDELREQGVEFSLGYLSETATNLRGGDRELWRYADQWTFATTLDLEKILGLRQAKFQITLTDRNGRNLSLDAHLGSLQEVQEIYGRGQTWHWTQFHYDQKYLDGMLDWKIGRLVGAEDFADSSCEFMNLTFCGQAPGNIAIDFWYTWPVSQWGTRLKVAVKDFGYVQFGAYESNPRYMQTRNGLDLGEPGGATGMLTPFEVGWQPTFGDGLDGSYKFGLWYNSSRAADVVDAARFHGGHTGAYVDFLQHVWQASFFLNAAFNDRETSTLDHQISIGVFYNGVFASRPEDKVGFAIGRTHVNHRATAAIAELPASESLAELFYSLRVASWLDVRPSVQLIHQQRDIERNPDALIVGVRLSVVL